MRTVFALWMRALRARPGILWQSAVPYLVVASAGSLGMIPDVHPALAAILRTAAAALLVALFAFTYGAALGAIGEAVRGGAPTPYFSRGRRLFGRSLGTLGLALLAAIPAIVIGGAGLAALIAAALGAAFDGSSAGGLLLVAFGLLTLFMLAALLTAPFIYCLEAGVFLGGRKVTDAFRAAFGEAYRGGRIWRWLLVSLIAGVLTTGADFAYALPAPLGVLLPIAAGALALWLTTTLAFANWQRGSD